MADIEHSMQGNNYFDSAFHVEKPEKQLKAVMIAQISNVTQSAWKCILQKSFPARCVSFELVWSLGTPSVNV